MRPTSRLLPVGGRIWRRRCSPLSQVRPGSIVVMHLVGEPNAPATADALEEIIPALRACGYELVELEELLRHQG